MNIRILVLSLSIAIPLTAITSGSPRAQSAAEFYKGRQLTLLVSHPAGGGVDNFARFYGRHLGRLLAGNPTVVVQNMPGAAGVTMANHIFTQAAKDGSVIGFGSGWLATAAPLGQPGARYDARQLSWIGSMSAEVAVVIAWHTQPHKTAADLLTTELTVGAGGTADLTATAPLSMARLLGMKFKVITGYAGVAQSVLALERGEIGGIAGYNYGGLRSVRPDWLKDKKVSILLQYAFDGHPDLAGVATLADVAGKGEARTLLELMVLPQEMARPIFAPPGIPADRLKALRDAFDAFVKDAAVQADSQKTQLELYKPMSGEKVAAMVDRLHAVGPDLYAKAAAAMLPADMAKK